MAVRYNFIFSATGQFGSVVNVCVYVCVCVSVRVACACARVRVRVRMCVCVCVRQFPALDIGWVMGIMNEDFLVSPEPNQENSGRAP
jgi:hypothetical protein